MPYYCFLSFLLLLLITLNEETHANEPSTPPSCEVATPAATLIVSYHTGPKEDRLERVRFRLYYPNGDIQLYPKSSTTTPLTHSQQRIVVIEGLPPGQYQLQFLVPNRDYLFEEVPVRKIMLNASAVHKVDQHIKPRYAALKAQAHCSDDWLEGQLPTITLVTSSGEMRAQSTVGKLSVHYLLPGRYQLIFEPLHGYATPEPLQLMVDPYASLGPIVATYMQLSP